ncbi:hypothetical protein [uncultured Duncaniella sp.]|jgi:hypothetical protein|uniref:hypothetical protein n=1 Tax=uncultured Duncaniella sp. TaxID=2768039 RepID=UPI0025B6790A|nr:hypothetical protein [uncultured Duncaniella sp.]
MRELDLHKAKTADTSKQKNDAKNAKPKSVLEAFEYIVELAEDSNLDREFLDKASTHIKLLLSGKKRQNHIFSTNIISYTCFTKKGLSFEAM